MHVHDEHEFTEVVQLSAFDSKGARRQSGVDLFDDTCGIALELAEVLFDLVMVIGVPGVLIEVLDAIHAVDRALVEFTSGEREEVDNFRHMLAGLAIWFATRHLWGPAGMRELKDSVLAITYCADGCSLHWKRRNTNRGMKW